MFKLITKLFCFTMISLFLVSCSTIKSEHYVGKKVSMHKELEKESIWQFEDKMFYVKVIGKGESETITASSLQWNRSEKRYEVETSQIVMSELKMDDSKQLFFLNLKKEKDDLYTILHIIPSSNDKELIFFPVNTATIKKHIKDGKVKAVKKDDAFVLKLSKEELDSYIYLNVHDLFDFSSAGVIRALKGYNSDHH